MNDLKPCPFCGGKAEEDPDMTMAFPGVYCSDCGAEAAKEVWNTRTLTWRKDPPDVPEEE